jgi:peptidoglycan-associated lipoprotein
MNRQVLIVALSVICLWIAGCKKKVASAPPPPPVVAEAAAPAEPAPESRPDSPAPPPAHAPPAAAAAQPAAESFEQQFARLVRDVYFDYDRYAIREDAREALFGNSQAIRLLFERLPGARVRIEGHADERGSAEYNLALGDRRAAAVREFVVSLGVPESRLAPISYGKERPQCTDRDEDCWRINRRAHCAAAHDVSATPRD